MLRAPIEMGEAKIRVRQRASDSDMADAERRHSKRRRLFFERILCRRVFHRVRVEVRLWGLRPSTLVAPENKQIQQAATERVTAQRGPARLCIRGKQFRPVVQGVEILANDTGIVER